MPPASNPDSNPGPQSSLGKLPAAAAALSFFLITVCGTYITAHSAQAALGAQFSATSGTSTTLKTTGRVAETHPSYTIHETQTEANTLREFVSQDGIVFGMTWIGLGHPDLSQHLGSHYGVYQASKSAAPAPRGARASSFVEAGELVVQTWGHARKLQGRAYLRSKAPEGVSLNEIQ